MKKTATELKSLFAQFAAAVHTGDAPQFEALTVRDRAPATDIFLDNSRRAREQGWSFALEAIVQEGAVATMHFRVTDGDGSDVGLGELTASEEPEGWRIRAL